MLETKSESTDLDKERRRIASFIRGIYLCCSCPVQENAFGYASNLGASRQHFAADKSVLAFFKSLLFDMSSRAISGHRFLHRRVDPRNNLFRDSCFLVVFKV